MYFFRNMLNNKIYLKSHNYYDFDVAMSINDILEQLTLMWYENVYISFDSEMQVLLTVM